MLVGWGLVVCSCWTDALVRRALSLYSTRVCGRWMHLRRARHLFCARLPHRPGALLRSPLAVRDTPKVQHAYVLLLFLLPPRFAHSCVQPRVDRCTNYLRRSPCAARRAAIDGEKYVCVRFAGDRERERRREVNLRPAGTHSRKVASPPRA